MSTPSSLRQRFDPGMPGWQGQAVGEGTQLARRRGERCTLSRYAGCCTLPAKPVAETGHNSAPYSLHMTAAALQSNHVPRCRRRAHPRPRLRACRPPCPPKAPTAAVLCCPPLIASLVDAGPAGLLDLAPHVVQAAHGKGGAVGGLPRRRRGRRRLLRRPALRAGRRGAAQAGASRAGHRRGQGGVGTAGGWAGAWALPICGHSQRCSERLSAVGMPPRRARAPTSRLRGLSSRCSSGVPGCVRGSLVRGDS